MALSIYPQLRVDDIPNFLRARSADGLRRAMLKNNVRLKAHIQYFDIQWHESEGRWYAWFYSSLTRDENQSVDDEIKMRSSEA